MLVSAFMTDLRLLDNVVLLMRVEGVHFSSPWLQELLVILDGMLVDGKLVLDVYLSWSRFQDCYRDVGLIDHTVTFATVLQRLRHISRGRGSDQQTYTMSIQ